VSAAGKASKPPKSSSNTDKRKRAKPTSGKATSHEPRRTEPGSVERSGKAGKSKKKPKLQGVAAARAAAVALDDVEVDRPVRAERRANGLAGRESVPFADQATWSASPNRADPIEILEATNTRRVPELVPIRYGRMMVSPFTYYRGSPAVMAADLAATATTGFTTQICGDAHLLNFGLFASPERSLLFDVNDFDETIPGPWEWDLKRLTASLVIAGRDRGFADRACRDLAAEATRSYCRHMARSTSGTRAWTSTAPSTRSNAARPTTPTSCEPQWTTACSVPCTRRAQRRCRS
jgi:hypothetical protein